MSQLSDFAKTGDAQKLASQIGQDLKKYVGTGVGQEIVKWVLGLMEPWIAHLSNDTIAKAVILQVETDLFPPASGQAQA